MIAVWIIAASFTLVGALYTGPKWFRLLSYRGRATGTFVSAQSGQGTGSQPMRARYRYEVDGRVYEGSSGWTKFIVVRRGGPCKVRYSLSDPSRSYLAQFGTYANIAIGTVFFLVGLAAFGVGAMLVAHYPELLG